VVKKIKKLIALILHLYMKKLGSINKLNQSKATTSLLKVKLGTTAIKEAQTYTRVKNKPTVQEAYLYNPPDPFTQSMMGTSYFLTSLLSLKKKVGKEWVNS